MVCNGTDLSLWNWWNWWMLPRIERLWEHSLGSYYIEMFLVSILHVENRCFLSHLLQLYWLRYHKIVLYFFQFQPFVFVYWESLCKFKCTECLCALCHLCGQSVYVVIYQRHIDMGQRCSEPLFFQKTAGSLLWNISDNGKLWQDTIYRLWTDNKDGWIMVRCFCF